MRIPPRALQALPVLQSQYQVFDNPAKSRFEIHLGNGLAVASYEVRGKALAFTHTYVPTPSRGKGIAEELITGALALVRSRGQKFIPACSFVEAYVVRHPEVRDLLA